MNNMFDVFLKVIKTLEDNHIPYMVVGSLASTIYGDPRMTHDMDLVVDIMPQANLTFEKIFPFDEFYCPPAEILGPEIARKGQFNLIHHESGLKVDLVVKKATPHAQEEFKRRQKIMFWNNVEVYMATPEDIIIKKLDYYRQGGSEKHLNDIRSILAQTNVDNNYLEKWIHALGLQQEWSAI